jgi:ectoine hydroxylase-related dioxygenase (phytanoyl-CoA dioxygenase family)
MDFKTYKQKFKEDGYFIIKNAIDHDALISIQNECDRLVAIEKNKNLENQEITNINKVDRYFIKEWTPENQPLTDFLFSKVMSDICLNILGDNAQLFYEQFVVKGPEKGGAFGWHQDSGYVGFDQEPYLSCWVALDDINEENGTIYVLPNSHGFNEKIQNHSRDKTGDNIGYRGNEFGIPAIVKAGDIVCFSSLTLHRSGFNTSKKFRRAYLAQYSATPIILPDGSGPHALAEPILINGKRVYEAALSN